MMANYPIVDEKDEIIGYKESLELKKTDIRRASALWITNSYNEVLLAKRSMNKKLNPGLWETSVVGTVEKDETYETNIIKEAEEELGLKDIKPVKAMKVRYSTINEFYCQWFTLNIDIPISEFKPMPGEVDEVRWINKVDLEKELEEYPERFVPSFKEDFGLFNN